MSYQYRKPASLIAPSIVDKLDRNGNFVERIDTNTGFRYDRNGDRRF